MKKLLLRSNFDAKLWLFQLLSKFSCYMNYSICNMATVLMYQKL